jgi:hypothetical protein
MNMNARKGKWTIGVALLALVTCTAGVSWANPYKIGPPYHQHPHGPIIVAPAAYPPVAYCLVNSANPAAAIRLVNPLQNQVALRYRLNSGMVQVLPAGCRMDICQQSAIEFDRGGAAGWALYGLTCGTYKFLPANGYWTLVHETAESVFAEPTPAANPVPTNPTAVN